MVHCCDSKSQIPISRTRNRYYLSQFSHQRPNVYARRIFEVAYSAINNSEAWGFLMCRVLMFQNAAVIPGIWIERRLQGLSSPYVKISLIHQGKNWIPLKTPAERERNYKAKDAVCALRWLWRSITREEYTLLKNRSDSEPYGLATHRHC